MHSGIDPPERNNPRSVARRPFPDTTPNRSWRSRPPETSGSAQVRLSHLFFSSPSPPAAAVFDFRAHFCHSAPMKTHAFGFRLRANAPEGQKRFPISRPPSLGGRFPLPFSYPIYRLGPRASRKLSILLAG